MYNMQNILIYYVEASFYADISRVHLIIPAPNGTT